MKKDILVTCKGSSEYIVHYTGGEISAALIFQLLFHVLSSFPNCMVYGKGGILLFSTVPFPVRLGKVNFLRKCSPHFLVDRKYCWRNFLLISLRIYYNFSRRIPWSFRISIRNPNRGSKLHFFIIKFLKCI